MDEKEPTRELLVVDVRHYKKVKKALHESEERYRHLFENMPIGMYRTTPDGRIVDANPALVKMAGFDSFAEMAQLNLNSEYSKAGHERADFIQSLKRDGEVKGLESIWKTRDGSEIHVRENAKLIRDETGEVFFEGTIEDITQSKLAEAAKKIRSQQLEILNRIISSGNMAESMVEMLENILDCVIELLAFDAAGVYMVDPETRKVNLITKRGAPSRFVLMEKYMAIDNMPFSQVLGQGQPVFVDTLRDALPDLARKWKWQMVCSVPLVSKGRVVGAMNVASSRRSVFSPEEKSILELIGKEAGTLISKLQTEKALRDSEKYYRTLIDMSPDIICVLDLKGNLTMVNQRFLQIGGYFYDEVIGHNVLEFVQELKLSFLLAGIKKFLKTKKLDQVEYPIKRKDGTFFPMEMAISLLTDSKGKPTAIMGVGRDISERRQAEEALRQSESKYRELVENHNDVIFAVDVTGKIEYLSPAIFSMTGYTFDEVTGKNLFGFFSPEDSKRYGEQMRQTTASGNSVGEFLITIKDNSKKWIRASSRVVKENGKVTGLRGIMSDITALKQAEQELLESKALIEAVLENVPLMIFIKEATDLRFVIFNRAGEELLGRNRKSLLGKSNLDLFPAEQAAFFMAKDREVLDGGADMLDIPEEPILTARKGQRLLHTRKVCIRGADGVTKYLLGISEDITERKEAEAKLLAYQEQLRALTSEMMLVEGRERRRIASELHDQIGQNLALCKLKVATLEKNLEDTVMKGELSVVRRLLECSIQDARSLIFDLSPPVLYELGFAAALEWLTERMQEQFHIPVEFECHCRELALGNDQQVILFQVVREVLINVGKHSRARKAKIILAREGPSLKIRIHDDGVGFDAERVFAPREPNQGFGFFSMRERVNYLGGGLEVKSRPGHGAQIILTVPQPGRGAVPKKEKP